MSNYTSMILRAALLGLAVVLPIKAEEAKKAEAKSAGPDLSFTPIVSGAFVGGNQSQFKSDWWRKDDFTGGIDNFKLETPYGKEGHFLIEGRGIFDEDNYNLRLEWVNPKVGFIRAGFTEYPKYFKDTGGYYPLFINKSIELNHQPRLNIGNYYVDLGLTLPEWPVLTIGYEHQFKNGDKSMVEWGRVRQDALAGPTLPNGNVSKGISPAYKAIDEVVDIFKAGAEYDIKNVHLEDQFRFELYNNSLFRTDDYSRIYNSSGALTFSQTVTAKEHLSNYNVTNTFVTDSHVNDNVYLSAGYMFSELQGDADITLNTTPFTTQRAKNWASDALSLSQDSHVVNLASMFGPFKGLTFSAGVQAEKTTTRSSAVAVLTEVTSASPLTIVSPVADLVSRNDKTGVAGTFGVRYTSIPYTTLFVDIKLAQENLDLFEREIEDSELSFQRLTNTDVTRQDYSAGFSTAPFSKMTFTAKYHHGNRENDYNNTIDETVDSGGLLIRQDGYPAFIDGQEFITDDLSAKLTFRPCPRFNAALKYMYKTSDIFTTFDDTDTGIPAGTQHSGQFRSNNYSVAFTLTPTHRMYLNALFNYQPTRTIAFDNHATSVTPYDGDVFSVLATAGIALDNKTDLTAQYSYFMTSNFVNNGFDKTPPIGAVNNDYSVPYGLDNERHAVFLTLARRINRNVTVRAGYGYVQFRQPSNGGIDDYTANLASISCAIHF